MPIPPTREFEEVLSSLSLVRSLSDHTGAAKELLIRPAIESTGEISPQDRLHLTVATGITISIDSLINRTAKELQQAGHVATEELTVWFLAICCACVKIVGKVGSVAELNSLINSIGNADVNLYYTFPARIRQEYAFRLGNFAFGPLDVAKLRYQCERAESDYFIRWESLLRHRTAVQRDPLRVRVLDISRIQQRFGDPKTKDKQSIALWETLINGYFGVLASQLFETFLNELYESQHVLVAFGAPRLDPRLFSRLIGANMVAVFLNIGDEKVGFVAPATIGQIRIDLVNQHKRIPQTVNRLRTEFGFHAFDGSPLHELIRLFVKFVSRATELHDDNSFDEALIQLIVALEIVFAERRNIADTTGERAAAVICAGSKVDFRDVRDGLGNLYEKRSRYVHQGSHTVKRDEIDDLFLLIKPILEALMRLQADPRHRTKESIQRWLVHLDFAAKSLVVGRELEEKDRVVVLGFVIPSL